MNDLQPKDSSPAKQPANGEIGAPGRAAGTLLRRRTLLAGLIAQVFSGAICGSGAAAPPSGADSRPDPGRARSRLDTLASSIEPRLHLRDYRKRKEIDLRFYGSDGYDMNAVRRADWFMRDRRENQSREMDVRLYWALAALSQAALRDGGPRPVGFLSGYRTEKTNRLIKGAAKNSLHMKGRAVDFFIPGVPVGHVADYVEWLQVGGVGHYRNRFVHIDTGRIRRWDEP